jgi:hypothetical protein
VWVVATQTGGTAPAGGVYFADDPLAHPSWIGAGQHRADEFVAEDPVEALVAPGYLDVGIANPSRNTGSG